MPHVAADFVHPVGELEESWFPNDDLAAFLTGWITLGEADAPDGATADEVDAVALAYTYWRAYDTLTMRMAFQPDSSSLEGLGSSGSLKEGRGYFAGKADQWKTALDTAIAASVTPGSASSNTPAYASGTVPFSVSF